MIPLPLVIVLVVALVGIIALYSDARTPPHLRGGHQPKGDAPPAGPPPTGTGVGMPRGRRRRR